MLKSISLCAFTLILLLCMTSGDDVDDNLNPYRELGVSRNANEKQIKNAYRKMAKLWHPDRNKEPGAEAKFMRISRSYEILSDSERRQMYDDYGSTQEPRHGHQQHGHRDNFDNFFRDFHFGGGGGFRFNGGGGFNQRRKSTAEEINKKIFDETIIPNSHTKPFLIFSYTEFCYSCMHVDKEWEELKKEIKNIGFGAGHSDASWNRELSKALGINTVPSIAGIINGRIYHFRGEYTLKNLREFVRGLLPSNLVSELTMENFNKTLHDTVEENKVMAVFASFSNQPTLRYQMPCFVLSTNVKCTFLRLNAIDTNFHEFLAKNHLMQLARSKEDKEEALFLFKENLQGNSVNGAAYKPAFNIRARELSYPSVLQTFEQNKFLHLPRISSTQHFYDLCTSWSNQNNLDEMDQTQAEKVLCILISADSSESSPNFLFNPTQKAKFLKKIIADDFFKKSARFTTVYYDIQTEFFEKMAKTLKIKPGEQKNEKTENFFKNKIIVLKRLDEKYAQFEVFDFEDTESDSLMKQQLDALKSVLKGTKHLDYKLIIPDFYDESTNSLLVMVMEYLEEAWRSVTDRYFWERLLGNSSYMMVIFCTVLFIWLMMMFSADQSDPLSASRAKKTKTTSKESKRGSNFNIYSSPDASAPENQSHYYRDDNHSNSFDTTAESESHYFRSSKRRCHFELSEMTEETYDYFVKQLPNGLRTILLIVTDENREQLIQKFVQVAYQFSNKSYHLRFAYLNVSKPSSRRWINEIMFQKYRALEEENDIDISEDEYDDAIKATLNKLDYENSLITMAINQQRRHFLLHELDISHLYTTCDAEMCYGLEDINRFENKYQIELANWLDKLTEGLSMSKDKFTIKKWPEFM